MIKFLSFDTIRSIALELWQFSGSLLKQISNFTPPKIRPAAKRGKKIGGGGGGKLVRLPKGVLLRGGSYKEAKLYCAHTKVMC